MRAARKATSWRSSRSRSSTSRPGKGEEPTLEPLAARSRPACQKSAKIVSSASSSTRSSVPWTAAPDFAARALRGGRALRRRDRSSLALGAHRHRHLRLPPAAFTGGPAAGAAGARHASPGSTQLASEATATAYQLRPARRRATPPRLRRNDQRPHAPVGTPLEDHPARDTRPARCRQGAAGAPARGCPPVEQPLRAAVGAHAEEPPRVPVATSRLPPARRRAPTRSPRRERAPRPRRRPQAVDLAARRGRGVDRAALVHRHGEDLGLGAVKSSSTCPCGSTSRTLPALPSPTTQPRGWVATESAYGSSKVATRSAGRRARRRPPGRGARDPACRARTPRPSGPGRCAPARPRPGRVARTRRRSPASTVMARPERATGSGRDGRFGSRLLLAGEDALAPDLDPPAPARRAGRRGAGSRAAAPRGAAAARRCGRQRARAATARCRAGAAGSRPGRRRRAPAPAPAPPARAARRATRAPRAPGPGSAGRRFRLEPGAVDARPVAHRPAERISDRRAVGRQDELEALAHRRPTVRSERHLDAEPLPARATARSARTVSSVRHAARRSARWQLHPRERHGLQRARGSRSRNTDQPPQPLRGRPGPSKLWRVRSGRRSAKTKRSSTSRLCAGIAAPRRGRGLPVANSAGGSGGRSASRRRHRASGHATRRTINGSVALAHRRGRARRWSDRSEGADHRTGLGGLATARLAATTVTTWRSPSAARCAPMPRNGCPKADGSSPSARCRARRRELQVAVDQDADDRRSRRAARPPPALPAHPATGPEGAERSERVRAASARPRRSHPPVHSSTGSPRPAGAASRASDAARRRAARRAGVTRVSSASVARRGAAGRPPSRQAHGSVSPPGMARIASIGRMPASGALRERPAQGHGPHQTSLDPHGTAAHAGITPVRFEVAAGESTAGSGPRRRRTLLSTPTISTSKRWGSLRRTPRCRGRADRVHLSDRKNLLGLGDFGRPTGRARCQSADRQTPAGPADGGREENGSDSDHRLSCRPARGAKAHRGSCGQRKAHLAEHAFDRDERGGTAPPGAFRRRPPNPPPHPSRGAPRPQSDQGSPARRRGWRWSP